MGEKPTDDEAEVLYIQRCLIGAVVLGAIGFGLRGGGDSGSLGRVVLIFAALLLLFGLGHLGKRLFTQLRRPN